MAPPSRSAAGQASTELVGLCALVAVVLTGALAAAGGVPLGGVGTAVQRELRHAICVVTGAVCTPAQARRDGLAPCPVHVRSDTEDAEVAVGLVRVGRDDALAVERRSDGTATVAFLDGFSGGAEAGIGVRIAPLGVEGRAAAGGGVHFAAGKEWTFPTWAAADAFVERHARHETLTGEVRRRLCLWCGRDDPPPPGATYLEGGAYADATADLGLEVAGHGAGLDLEAGVATVLGRRRAGRRHSTYVRVSGEGAGRLGVVAGALATESAGEAVLEVVSDAGRPAELRVSVAGTLGAQLEVLGATTDLGGLAERLRGAAGTAGGGALAAEATTTLDLRDPGNLAVARAAIATLRDPAALPGRLAALGRRLDSHGALDLRVLRASTGRRETGAEAGLGVQAGFAYERTERRRELLRAWSRAPGDVLRDREDCAATASARA